MGDETRSGPEPVGDLQALSPGLPLPCFRAAGSSVLAFPHCGGNTQFSSPESRRDAGSASSPQDLLTTSCLDSRPINI